MEQFFEAYWWLHCHPMFAYKGELGKTYSEGAMIRTSFPDNLDIHVAKVDPKTRSAITDDKGYFDKTCNTHVEIWIEVMTYCDPNDFPDNQLSDQDRRRGVATHFWELDCGGDTFEEAIITLARDVHEKFPRDDKPLPDILQTGA
jgi:hypothetical protein